MHVYYSQKAFDLYFNAKILYIRHFCTLNLQNIIIISVVCVTLDRINYQIYN